MNFQAFPAIAGMLSPPRLIAQRGCRIGDSAVPFFQRETNILPGADTSDHDPSRITSPKNEKRRRKKFRRQVGYW
jgi:hypothetical protein